MQQLANIKRMLSSVSESVREMGQRQCIHFGRIAETTSRLNDLIVIQTEFRQSFLSAHPLIFDEVELKWFLNQFRIQFTKCVKNREHRYQFPMPVHGANWEFWSISWFPPTAAIVGSGKMGKAWGFKKLIWFPSLNKKAKH